MSISEILSAISHRPWPIPSGKWVYYQEWNQTIFLHWEVKYDALRKLVAPEMELDSFEGKYYISVVPFSMQYIRPRSLPAVGFISNFHEINVRTYVLKDNKPGVLFLNIEAEKWISTFIAKQLSGLPYEKASINRNKGNYNSNNLNKGFYLHIDFEIKNQLTSKSDLDKWLTERYCLYLKKDNRLFRYEIHHQEWELNEISIDNLKLNYKLGEVHLNESLPYIAHYSKGVQVLAWEREVIF
ncbi:YqjF family protein [Pseudopedobacter beijingensis]|uniref:YqjF family protein n=1 Tax=Pseudopedobacter beijingensis TaxID=1207056 RepID=A0ABW4IAH8_9SPHI